MLGRRRNKLDPKLMSPFAVIENHEHTIDIAVNVIPECTMSDRVRTVLGRVELQNALDPDTDNFANETSKPVENSIISLRPPEP